MRIFCKFWFFDFCNFEETIGTFWREILARWWGIKKKVTAPSVFNRFSPFTCHIEGMNMRHSGKLSGFGIFVDWTTFWTLFGFALTGRVFIRFPPFKDHSMQHFTPDFLPTLKFWKIEQLFEQILDLLSRPQFLTDPNHSHTIQCRLAKETFWYMFFDFRGLNNFLNSFWICSHGHSFQPIRAVQRPFNAAFYTWFFAYTEILKNWTIFWTDFWFALTAAVFDRSTPFTHYSM